MTKEQIIEYVMHTPMNTNPAVLRSMLGSIEGGGGGILFATIHKREGNSITCDKTYAEIVAAIPTGVIARIDVSGEISVGVSYLPVFPNSPVTFSFLNVTDEDQLSLETVNVASDNTVTSNTSLYPLST